MSVGRFVVAAGLALGGGVLVWALLEGKVTVPGEITLPSPPQLGVTEKPVPLGATSERPVQLPGPQVVRSDGAGAEEADAIADERIAAKLCLVCGEIPAGGAALLVLEDGSRWHKRCDGPRCRLTGRPIPTGTSRVDIEGYTYGAAAYDRAERCLASGLPLPGQGEHVINPRSGTKVLSAHLSRTLPCVSCRDQLLVGWEVGGVGFACTECAKSFNEEVKANKEEMLADVRAFFTDEGLPPPPVELYFATQADGLSKTERGRCETTTYLQGLKQIREHRILILSHLSKPVALTVLAHEMTHAIVSDRDIPDLEGFCELAAWQYARSRGLPQHVITGIEENRVSDYRDGFQRQRAKNKSLLEIVREE